MNIIFKGGGVFLSFFLYGLDIVYLNVIWDKVLDFFINYILV